MQGGRAFYKAPSPAGKVGGKRGQSSGSGWGEKRDIHSPSGSNALPPHVNVTMFRQQGNWVNPSVEVKSCTWKAVEERKDVGSCK